MAHNPPPKRGEIWLADLHPTRGHEQTGRRPVVIISDDLFNSGPADLIIVLPVTSRIRGIPSHIVVQPPEGSLRKPSAVICEGIRSITKQRLVKRWGIVSPATLNDAEDALRILLSFKASSL